MTKIKVTTRKKNFTKAIKELFDGIALECERLNRHEDAQRAKELKKLYLSR